MAQRFLDSLPKMPKEAQAKGAECMICKEAYGTVPSDNGTIEHAVLLPCLHHVGSECIAIWLSPDDGIGNSCPLCRTVFFPNYLRDHDDEDEEGDEDDGSGYSDEDDNEDENDERYDDEEDGEGHDDEDECGEGHDDEDGEDGDIPDDPREQIPMTLLAVSHRVESCLSFTTPPSEVQREGEEWFERWPLPTRRQISEHEKRARTELLRPPPPPPSDFLQARTPSSETHQPPAADPAAKVARLASSAYRTLAFRETLLYMKLTEAEARIAPLVGSPHNSGGLSTHQDEMHLWELGQRGAFSDARVQTGVYGWG